MKKNKEFNSIVEALKKSNECGWVGTTKHDCIEKCLIGINLYLGLNSGHYNPKCIRINGLKGYYMINENNTLCFEARVVKKSDKEFMIEYLSDSEYNKLISRLQNN